MISIETMQPITAWLHAHPHAAGWVAFVISFVESLALIGLFIPGSVTMGAIGALIGSGTIPATETFILAIIGACAGDALSYWLGAHFHQHIRQIWPFSAYPKWLDKGENFFREHGGKSVFMGRFIGPMRPIIPLIAGIVSMPFKKFFPISLIASCGWAPTYMLPGILVGAAAMQVSSKRAAYLMIETLLVILIALSIMWFLKTCLDRYLEEHPRTKRLGLLIFTIIIFAIMASSLRNLHLLLHWNALVYELMFHVRSTMSDHAMVAITLTADHGAFFIAIGLSTLAFFVLRYYRVAFFFGLNGFLGFGFAYIIKHTIDYPRPPGLLIPNLSPSFPSGHVTAATLIFGMLAVLINQHIPLKKRWMSYSLCSLPVILMAFSRLYLNVHWITDVLGAMMLGLISVQFCTICMLYHRRPEIIPPVRTTLSIILISVTLGWLWMFTQFYEQEKIRYRLKPQQHLVIHELDDANRGMAYDS